MRKTKIICTIGPACESEEMITKLCEAGMNVARLNLSHGTHDEHLKRIEMIRKVREKLNLPIAIMLDTKGPEYRIGTFADKKITLNAGQKFSFTTQKVDGDVTRVSVSYKNLAKELCEGDTILLNNGLLEFKVISTTDDTIDTEVVTGGELSDRKSMSFPGKYIKQKYLSEQDIADITFGVQNGIDFIACSFVSVADDLKSVHTLLKELGHDEDVELIAKIENRSGCENIDEICKECDGIMVARGDLGVEVPMEELPAIQKELITKCRLLGRRVITATEMLESMIHNPRPTRAEASDVANAVYDGTSAVMLSGETAAGAYPIQAVATMARITEATENTINYTRRFHNNDFIIQNEVDAISHATCQMAIDLKAKVIVASTISGMTARMISRFRCPVDIIGLTTDDRTWRKLSLSWAVTPVRSEVFPSTEVLFYSAKRIAKETCELQNGDKIVITGGMTNGQSGNTNLIKIESI